MRPQIIFEDESYSRAFEAGELSEAGAVTLVGEGGKLTTVTCVKAAEGAVRDFLARYADATFSPDAIAFLDASLAPLFTRFGYERDPESPYTTVAFSTSAEYSAAICGKAQNKPLPDGVSLVWCADREGERYDFSQIEGGDDDGECALCVRGYTVLAVAGINDLRRDGYSEIYVECAESARRLGLGSACVRLLCSRLFAAGQGVRYETTGDNFASLALAHSLGLRECERIVSFSAVC